MTPNEVIIRSLVYKDQALVRAGTPQDGKLHRDDP